MTDSVQSISLVAAFSAGLLSFVSPCVIGQRNGAVEYRILLISSILQKAQAASTEVLP